MRRLLCLFMVLFLAGCGTEPLKSTGVDNMIENEVVEEPFTLRLVSEKEQYVEGEKPNIKAELTYNGDLDKVSIGHGGSWIWLITTNLTEDYFFDAAMIEPYIVSEMKKGEPLVQQYQFSGSYDESKGYSEEIFKRMSEMDFPPGQYEIKGRTDFHIDGEQPSTNYSLETKIIFEVIED